jgi:hypothetical protein
MVHTSCEQTHEAIRRGARQAGKRVYGEPPSSI